METIIKRNYSWLICIVCLLMQFCVIGMSATSASVYISYFISDSGLSNTQAFSLTSIRSVASALSLIFMDRFVAALGLRKAAFAGPMFTCIGHLIAAFSGTYYMAYCAAFVFNGIGYSFGGVVLSSIIIYRWFEARTNLALGIAALGSGLSTVICPPIITLIINKWSLRASLVTGSVFVFCVSVLAYLLIYDRPEDIGLPKYSSSSDNAKLHSGFGHDIIVPAMVLYLAACFALGISSTAGASSFASYFRQEGFSPMQSSYMLSVYGFSLMIGKLLFGWLADKKGSRYATAVVGSLLVAGYVLNCLAGLHIFLLSIIGMFVCGAGIPVCSVGVPSNSRALSTEKTFTYTLKNAQFFYTAGGIASGLIIGIIADASGKYIWCMAIATLMSLFYLVSLMIVHSNVCERR